MTLLYIYIYLCVFTWFWKDFLDSAPFQADDKRRCCGSNGQKSQPRRWKSKQLTSGKTAHPWILTAKPIQNSSNHPKSKKKSQMLNLAIQKHSEKPRHFCFGSKKRPTMVFVIGLFSEHRRTSAEGFSKVTRHRRRASGWGVGRRLVKVTWAHREKVTTTTFGRNQILPFLMWLQQFLMIRTPSFPHQILEKKFAHVFSQKTKRLTKAIAIGGRFFNFLMLMPRYVYTRNRKAAAKTLLTINFKQNPHGDSNHPVSQPRMQLKPGRNLYKIWGF